MSADEPIRARRVRYSSVGLAAVDEPIEIPIGAALEGYSGEGEPCVLLSFVTARGKCEQEIRIGKSEALRLAELLRDRVGAPREDDAVAALADQERAS